MTKIFVVFLLFSVFGHAKPKEALLASDVCKSIDSNKYQAQCESRIRGGRFSSLAINTCVQLFKGHDSQLKSCMGVIKDKTFTQSEIDACLLKKKHLINKCLSVSGTLFKAESPTLDEATPVGH
jgi:hypothetical protein